MVRNYDYSPQAFDALVLRTHWERPVMGVSDGLFGLVDSRACGADASTPASGKRTASNAQSADERSARNESHQAGASRIAKAEHLTVVRKGLSTNSLQRTSQAGLPWGELSRKDRARANEILKSACLYRRLPTIAFEVRPEVYTFFSAHPDVTVSIWRAMNISHFKLWKTAENTYGADSGDGSVGTIEILHRQSESVVALCEGVYKSPLLPKAIQARSLVHLQTGFFRDKSGKTYASHRADVFVSFPSQTVEAAAKLISPLSYMIADRNFREISLFVRMMSLVMERQPGWVERLTRKLENVPESRKQEMLKICARAYVAARRREVALKKGTGDVSVKDILKPLQTARADSEEPARSVSEDSSSAAGEVVPMPTE